MKITFLTGALLGAAVLMTLAPGYAQEQKLEMDLTKALDIALSTNPTIKTAEMEIERYDYVRKEAMGSHLPTLSLSGQFTYNVFKSEMAAGISLSPDMSASATVDLSIPLLIPAVWSTMKMSRMQQELAVEQARSSRIDLVNAVRKAFYQVLLLERSYEVLEASATTIGETVENTRTMFDAGLASEYDLLTAEVQLSNLQPNIISTRNSIGIAKQMLRMYLSIPEDVEIELVGHLGDLRDTAFNNQPAGETDLADNSEIRQLDVQQNLMRQQIKIANTGYAPTLVAFGQYQIAGSDQNMTFMGMTGSSKWRWQRPFVAGIQASIPIFTGLKEHYKVKQLQNSVRQIDLQRDYLVQAKIVEARTAANNLIAAREKMIANEMTVTQADKAYSIARTRFDAGAGTMLEVNQAELNSTQARLNHSQAIYDFLAAQADYDKVVGREE